jgi:hypothetical protein
MRLVFFIAAFLLGSSVAVAAEPDWKKVDAIFGRSATQMSIVTDCPAPI